MDATTSTQREETMEGTMMTKVTPALVDETPTLLVAAREEGGKENASELVALEASMAFATTESTTKYTTKPSACQIANEPTLNEAGNGKAATVVAAQLSDTEYNTDAPASQIESAPTLEEIEREIAAAAQQRIEASLQELDEAHARIERERNAREVALKAAQERASTLRTDLDGLSGARATMERRAQTFLAGELLKATMEKIHLAFNVRQLELEDALAVAGAEVEEMQTEIHAALISDALELQMAGQGLEQLEAAAPDVANAVRLAASAQENIAAALQAVKEGHLRDAEVLLDKAKAGNAEPAQIAEVEQQVARAKCNLLARDLIARMNAQAEQIGGVRRIRKLMDEAAASNVANQVARSARRTLQTAREAASARYQQAIPIADHLASEGFVPVIGDGRIEVWKEISRNGESAHTPHAVGWTLDRVMLLREGSWKTETPRVPVTRQLLPERVQRSRWFKQHAARGSAPTE
jgi:hypothetical protein